MAGTFALTYTLTGTSPFDYRGGFLLSALSAAAIIIGAVCVPGGPIARALSLSPAGVDGHHLLRRLPVALPGLHRTRRRPDRPDAASSLLAVRLAATFALAAASYYLVERPVMEGVVLAIAAGPSARPSPPWW